MIKWFYNISLLVFSGTGLYLSYFYLNNVQYRLFGMFIAGMLFGIFLMNIKLNVKNERISTYKRELEKEAVLSTESDAKVKVLESKIEVLEKALENALKK